MNSADSESPHPQVAGFVVREISRRYSNWRAEGGLAEYLARYGVVGLTGIDTRAVTRHIRSRGAMRAGIASEDIGVEDLLRRILEHPRMEGLDLSGEVSTEATYELPAYGEARFHVLTYDFGVKSHSLELLRQRGCDITVLPSSTPASDVLDRDCDGLFISNGPGDPAAVGHALDAIRGLAERGTPVFGICLGHQLVARAFGGQTFKLLYGHRGGNHPVRRLSDGAVEITAQNHGFAVRATPDGEVAGAPGLRITHVNLNDGTVEGVEHRELPVFSVQYHPEAAPGPHDSRYLFDRFVAAMEESAARRA